MCFCSLGGSLLHGFFWGGGEIVVCRGFFLGGGRGRGTVRIKLENLYRVCDEGVKKREAVRKRHLGGWAKLGIVWHFSEVGLRSLRLLKIRDAVMPEPETEGHWRCDAKA